MSTPLDISSIREADLEGVGMGLVSEVVRIRDTNVVAKIPAISPVFPAELHEVEKRVYERVGEHPHILQYLGQSPPECGILQGALLFEYHPYNIRHCIHELHALSPHPQELPRQVAAALARLHSLNIIHADLGLHNLLLSEKGDAILCDFAGSGIDDTPPRVAHGTRYSDPARKHDATTQRDDVFALGSVMHELARGGLLFEGLDDGEVCGRLERREFPVLSGLPAPLGDVVLKCWAAPGYTARDALDELGAPGVKPRGAADVDVEARPARRAGLVAFSAAVALLAVVAWRAWKTPRP